MSQEETHYALLLQDVEGFKEETHFVGRGKQLKPVTVEKGSLLTYLNPSVVNAMKKNHECLVNYRVDHLGKTLRGDNPVKNTALVFVGSNVLFYLSKIQRDLLLGVANSFNRLEVLGRLEWVESLRKGSDVYVTISTITAPVRGIVRYIGSLPGEEGRKFGVELMEKRGQGTQDGSFKETEFFKCAKDCAVFVAMDKLTDGDTVKAARVTPTSDPSAVKSVSKDSHGDPIRLGDYVVFYNKFNMKQKGIVRWIGNNKTLLPDGTPIIGIEAETHLNLHDVPHNIKDRFIRDYFSSKKSKVFLPITFVKRDKSNSSRSPVNKKEPAHDCSGDLPNSPQEGVVKPPQPQSMARRESDSQLQILTRKENDIMTAQPRSLNETPSRHKAQHDYETLQDLIIPESCNRYNLEVGSAVQYFDQYGVIKWIGAISGSKEIHAGLEMEDDITGSGINGELMGVKYFRCKPGKGIFALLSSLKPDQRNREISGDAQPVDPNPYNLEVGSVIEYGEPIQYGVIKWIGELSGLEGLHAGVEMDDNVEEAHDGTWVGTEYYKCKPDRGMFVMLSGLKPGTRDKARGNQPTSKASTSGSDHKQANLTASKLVQVQNPYNLEVGSVVHFGDPLKFGEIKWIGILPGFGEIVQAGLKMDHEVDNFHDGTQNDEQYFPGRGRFVDLKLLKPGRISAPASTDDGVTSHGDSDRLEEAVNTHKFGIGSKIKHVHRYGVIKWIGNLAGLSNKVYAGVEMEEDVNNPQDGSWCGEQIFKPQPGRGKFLPLSALKPDDRHVDKPQPNNASVQNVVCKFEVTDMVQFSDPPQYGTIKWIGFLPGQDAKFAGVETEDYVTDPTDGKWKGTAYFHPPAGKGKFIPLSILQPDERFAVQAAQVNPLEKYKMKIEDCVRPPSRLMPKEHIGLPKGIQGQQNSCYLDATLYGMFAFSDAFDGLFLERGIDGANQEIQEIIQQCIVYPLRKNHLVPQESILELRSCLDKIQKSRGLTKDEKDPEEFLNILFKHIFHLESYLKIRRSTGKEGEFFVQLFLEPDADVKPDTESLLHKMFVEQEIIFDEYPTKLLLQIPRYGKQFKVFQKVIPKLELDITTICNIEQPCIVCGNAGNIICSKCCKEEVFVNEVKTPFFCDTCSSKWHSHDKRKQHKPWAKKCQDFTTGTLQLLSVLCIETSHYVCFTRIMGSGKDEWVFFDSMAERPADEFNRPEVKYCTDILNEWVYGDKDIINTTERPPVLARRFVQDVYLCIYIDKEGTMYQ